MKCLIFLSFIFQLILVEGQEETLHSWNNNNNVCIRHLDINGKKEAIKRLIRYFCNINMPSFYYFIFFPKEPLRDKWFCYFKFAFVSQDKEVKKKKIKMFFGWNWRMMTRNKTHSLIHTKNFPKESLILFCFLELLLLKFLNALLSAVSYHYFHEILNLSNVWWINFNSQLGNGFMN